MIARILKMEQKSNEAPANIGAMIFEKLQKKYKQVENVAVTGVIDSDGRYHIPSEKTNEKENKTCLVEK